MKPVIQKFHDLLARFKFRNPVSPEAADYMLKTRKTVLKATLDSFGQYGIITGITVSMNILARNMGLRLTMVQCRIILTAIITGTAVITATVIYLAASPLPRGAGKIEPAVIEEKAEVNIKPEIEIDPSQKKQISGRTGHRIGIERFEGDNMMISDSITDKIITELARVKGKDFVVDLRKNKKKNINLIVMGSSREFAGNILIKAKLVNVQSGKILVVESAKVSGMDKSGSACSKISEEIIKHVE